MLSALLGTEKCKMGLLGNLAAILPIPLTIGTFVLGYFLKMSSKYFPTALNCLSCDTRLDELGWNGAHCPGCCMQVRH